MKSGREPEQHNEESKKTQKRYGGSGLITVGIKRQNVICCFPSQWKWLGRRQLRWNTFGRIKDLVGSDARVGFRRNQWFIDR